jgi:hypothetical protein
MTAKTTSVWFVYLLECQIKKLSPAKKRALSWNEINQGV